MKATRMTITRAIALPLIVMIVVCNVLFIALQQSSSQERSTSILVGPNEIHGHSSHDAAARIRNFVQQSHQQQQGNAEGSSRKLHQLHKEGNPFLIFHVGPAHTFAAKLQLELTLLSSELATDKYTLMLNSTILTDSECHKSLNLARRKYYDQNKRKTGGKPLKQHLSEVACWNRALEVLKSYRAKGESVIVSDESLSNRFNHFEGLGLAPMDWIALEETVGDVWNIEIVVAYRRYVEWLPDALRADSESRYERRLQQDKDSKLKREETVVSPLFPDLVKFAEANGGVVGNSVNATYTSTLLERYLYRQNGKPKIPVTLLNVNDDSRNIGSNFVCDILYSSATACTASTTRRLDAPMTPKEARERLKLIKIMRNTPVQIHDFYDFVVAYAKEKALYPTDIVSKQEALLAIRYYQEEVLNRTIATMPLKCPKKKVYQQFLDVSLKHEQNLLPHYARSHDGDEEHRRKFWELTSTYTMLCMIDVTTVLRDRPFLKLLRELPNGLSYENDKKQESKKIPITTAHEKPKKIPITATKEKPKNDPKRLKRGEPKKTRRHVTNRWTAEQVTDRRHNKVKK